MAKETDTRPEKGLASALNRFLTGENGEPVDVKVEKVLATPDLVLSHKLQNTGDFDKYDFYAPLALLFLIFGLQLYMALMLSGPVMGGFFFATTLISILVIILFILALQVVLALDLFKRLRRRPSGKKIAGLVKPYSFSAWRSAYLAYIVSIPLVIGAHMLNQKLLTLIFPSSSPFSRLITGSLDGGVSVASIVQFLLAFFMIVIFAPVTEEIWFRGIGLVGFMRNNSSRLHATLWTSIVFGLLHGPGRFMFATLLGLLLSFIRFRTGSLYCCIAVHATHNFLVLVLALLFA